MDDSLRIFLWTLGGALSFALLGALFGGLAGWLSWRHGSATGSVVGRKVAEALARLRDGGLTADQRAAAVGAADGALFLGLVGTLIGLVAGRRGEDPAAWLLPVFAAVVLLVGGAALFGTLAYGLVRMQRRAVLGVSLGGMAGGLFAALAVGVLHIVPGVAAGILVGALVSLLLPPRRRP